MTDYIVVFAWGLSMCAAMPFTSKIVEAVYPEQGYIGGGDWLAIWFLNFFAALLWPLTLSAAVIRRWLTSEKS